MISGLPTSSMATTPQGLEVEWVDPRGKVWNLHSGEEGVRLDTGQSGLQASPVENTYSADGARLLSSRRIPPTLNLRLEIGAGLVGQDYFDLANEWWVQANSPTTPGTLRFVQPSGETREMQCRLDAYPTGEWTFDPGQPFHEEADRIEVWTLRGLTPYWQGEAQVLETASNVGETGTTTLSKFMFYRNEGDGPMWPVVELVGECEESEAVFPYGRVTVSIPRPGDRVIVDLDPFSRATLSSSGLAKDYVKVSWPALPLPAQKAGETSSKLQILSGAARYKASGKITVREQFARPF